TNRHSLPLRKSPCASRGFFLRQLRTKIRVGGASDTVQSSSRNAETYLERSVDIGQSDGGDGDPESEFDGVNGAGGIRMLGQFFGDSLGELRANMPEKRMAPRMEQAHEAVADENQASEFE